MATNKIIRLKQPTAESPPPDSTVTRQKISEPLPAGPSGVWRCPDSYEKASRRYQEIVGEPGCGKGDPKVRQIPKF